MSLKLRLYVSVVAIAAGLLLILCVPERLEERWPHYVAWAVISVLSETMWLATISKSGTVSMASTANLTTAALWGQAPAMWIAAISTLFAVVFVQRKPFVRAIFNAGQITITMWFASAVFGWLGGMRTGIEGQQLQLGTEALAFRLAPAFAGLFVAYLLVNRALVGVAVAWSSERPYLRTLREDWFYPERLLEDAAAFLLSPLMVISYEAIRYIGVVLFYVPLQMLHESARRHLELRSTQQQLIHTERMAAKGEMAAEIGHELRNQLVAISGRAQMLARDAERQRFDDVARNAQIILEQSKRMEGLSKGLMDFSAAELHIERVEVNALVQRSIEFVRAQNRFDGVEWDIRLSEPSPELRADPGQLQQVLLNLFMNAADAMKEKTIGDRIIAVTSSWDERTRQVKLVVTDTGSGIAPSNLARIFEPHFTTKAEGHGFGLSTSYRIITNHGGRIVATSPPGQGACFTVTLPQSRAGGLG
ncbi:MAG TPA: ATP-binding protein [Candidatus Sulfotelmatobacter sp.]|nr:ATP-binding protein [Candidatus Sulfotelmatobacter sp.]